MLMISFKLKKFPSMWNKRWTSKVGQQNLSFISSINCNTQKSETKTKAIKLEVQNWKKMSCEEGKDLPPHVLIFPYPVQGHLNSMLNLAHLFCLSDFHVTFIISDFNHRRLLEHTTVPAAFARYPGFQFRTLPDGLPDDHPRTGERALDLIFSIEKVTVPLFKKLIVQENFLGGAARRRVTCFVADAMSFAPAFAREHQLPLIIFHTTSASFSWALLCFPQLLQAQDIPFRGKSMDELVKSVPGMEGFLRRRDLPSFYRADDVNDPILQELVRHQTETVKEGVIFNTCEDLEGPVVAEIQKHVPRIFSVGPIHLQVKSRQMEKKAEVSVIKASLWAEDRRCIDWLDTQPPKSVIYVSFGSLTLVTRVQLLEFWHGLLDSSHRFLWVMRPDSITGNEGNEKVFAELMERSKEKGLLVEWAPQEKVLNHPAVGGFLTHSGWNSTLESIVAGVPMICWPYFGDQTTNSRFVSEVWKIGLDIKDTCDRLIIEKAVRNLMEVRKDEFLEKAENMAKLMKMSGSKGGSSYTNMDALVQYIKSLVL
ncbi:7-deoxyloganetic acid glucosyl transferase-like isoform X1 [Salvia miltiorrhiza]|uniref:7-deoxyloganetic acid glucosyl transferase-like isoform X1 n=1 Tax=Salvia miltiorrhiza TaxID=226208 RepID=UPI0025AC3D77|nr:7-deoxyloganetic acid glucosyl transferase-like isoform X1 [Salvia miltiorrhiza]